MRIVHLLHHAYHKDDHSFVAELYRQLLDRVPGEEEVGGHLNALWNGTSRNQLMIEFINSTEAHNLYFHGAEIVSPTAAGKLQRIVRLGHEDFVHQLYVELLCREPDPQGHAGHVEALRHGAHPLTVITNFMNSQEWIDLLHLDKNSISRRILQHLLRNM